ncbi:MAG: AAA family ATPase, partial [Treponema sp.]|nr:AAA family ATPase [Treponema sp.]
MDFTRKLPIGIQDFISIRTDGFLYVDKTEYLYRMVNEGKVYFLGRPRRFGKSLLLSTLKAYFEGKRELFEGLVIEKLERNWTPRPVIHIDFNFGTFTDFAGFQAGLDDMLRQIEEKWGGNAGDVTPAGRFFSVIRRAVEQCGQKAVVLIDEYDKPLLAHIEAGQVQEDIRAALKSFYGVLKSADPYLQFVLLTGVTRFSKVSVFSDLNQLRDISMSKVYAGLCGITEEELTSTFAPELRALGEEHGLSYEETLAKMRENYNGYCFSPGTATVYNPFSVLNTFADKSFRYYWYQTGTPTFLVKMIREQSIDITAFVSGITLEPEHLTDYRFSGGSPIPVLYQAGYLTIKGG